MAKPKFKKIISPKCPYCNMELTITQPYNSPVQNLMGQYCSDRVITTCPYCNSPYEIRKQLRFIARKIQD